MYGSYSILVHLCEVSGRIPFNSASVVFMIEAAKLLVSASMSLTELKRASSCCQMKLRSCLPFSIPAILYCVNNNMAVHMQLHMDPATFQVLSNLKITSTAVLYKLIIKRPISFMQWVSLLLLTLAGFSNSYGGLREKDKLQSPDEIYITWTGLALMSLYCFISGLAGVYSEYVLKKEYELSLSVQNMVLYAYGVLCNGLAYVIVPSDKGFGSPSGFFAGYSVYTWIIIVTQAANGLIMSVIMKHSSNITRLFYISCAMLVTTVLSVTVLSLRLNWYFVAACFLVVVALYLYHKK